MLHQKNDGPSGEATRRRAYEIWEAEGRPEGRDKENWAQAETEAHGGLAERQAPYSQSEQPGAGRPDTGTEMPEAMAQAGEGVPDSPDAGEPLAATPDAEPAPSDATPSRKRQPGKRSRP